MQWRSIVAFRARREPGPCAGSQSQRQPHQESRSMNPRGLVWQTLAAAVAFAAAGAVAAQKTQLSVYTALETDQLKAYQEGFYKANPDIEITWVRDSTGVITAKLLAEKANPKADVVMGVAA